MLQKDGLFRRREEPARASPVVPDPVAVKTEAPKPADVRSDERKEAKLIVGPDIKMKGVEVSDCDTLVVEGRMEATLDSRVLEIAEKGIFSGTVSVDSAEIRGRFEGELTVRKQLVVHATGRISGKIRYARIKVEEGAELAGEISVMDKDKVVQSPSAFPAQQRRA
jgi:cytoskeletal protein CcmA (bactofilin family)